MSNSLWVEKYRPDNLSEYIGSESFVDNVRDYINQQDIPHLLLYGKAGTGKTTAAKLLVKNIDCDYLYVNASDENSVDAIRFKIKAFAASAGFNDLKVVILDESDFLTPNAQAALRNLMETYSQTTRFILTCNYVEKIIDPIQSRCQVFHVTIPTKTAAAKKVATIMMSENINYDLMDVKEIVENCYPDLRRVINTAQKCCIEGRLQLDKTSLINIDFKKQVLASICNNKSVTEIRQILADNATRDYSELFTYLYENVEKISTLNTGMLVLSIAEYQYKDSLVVDKEINFAALLVSLKELKK